MYLLGKDLVSRGEVETLLFKDWKELIFWNDIDENQQKCVSFGLEENTFASWGIKEIIFSFFFFSPIVWIASQGILPT